MLLRDLREGGLIERIRAQFENAGVELGIGDDAAIVNIPAGHSIVFCSDLLAENTHFLRDLHPPDSVGYKAVAANVSDVGAMGGVALHFVISLAAPGSLDLVWVDGFYTGMARACREFGVSLVGGDSAHAEVIFADVAMIGSVRKGGAIKRSGARVGDGIYVTGTLGGSTLGLRRLRGGMRNDPAVERHLYPQPRHAVGAAVAAKAHAMIDVSDGLSTDLGHILSESKVSARIYRDSLPGFPDAEALDVLHGGEEYELIVTSADSLSEFPLTRIGEIVPSSDAHHILLVGGGSESILEPKGWQHF